MPTTEILTAAHIIAALLAVPGSLGRQYAPPAQIAADFNAAMARVPGAFTTDTRIRVLLASCLMESGWYRYLTEQQWGGSKPMDQRPYWPHIGRTLGQLTWASNYKEFGGWVRSLGMDAPRFEDEPERLGEPQWAALGPVWYCAVRPISGRTPLEWAADDEDPCYAIAACVNLGLSPAAARTRGVIPAGMADRRLAWDAIVAAGRILPEPEHTPEPEPTPEPAPEPEPEPTPVPVLPITVRLADEDRARLDALIAALTAPRTITI